MNNKSLSSVFLAVILMCSLILVGAICFGRAQSSTSSEPSSTSNFTISDSDSWPMFRNDLAHSGYSESTGPLTNQTLWKYQAGSGIESSPAVVDGVVYFGVLWNGHNGFVNALNAATGSKIWQFATDSGVESSPAVVDGVIYIGSYGGQVYALDAATGSRIWSFNAGGSVFPSPAVVDGKVYVGSASGDMYALDAAEGLPLWKYRTGGAIFSSPAVVDGVVYVGSQDQKIYALRADDGSVIWHYPTGSFVDTSPAVVGGIVYFGSRDGYVYALNAASGSKIWSFRPLHGNYGSYYYSTPAVIDGVIYVGGYDSYIYALNATNGNIFWEFRTGGYIFSSPVVAGGVVYVGSFDGNVYALNAVTGSKIWSYQTGDQMRSSAAVANGVVYVGSGDGYLYAFWSNTVDSPLTPSPSPSPSASPSPTTPKTEGEKTSFYDNFDDGVADGWTPQAGSWKVINGEYFISVGIVENGITTVNGLNLTDYTIETKLRFSDDVGFRAGLVFRYMEKDTYYSLEVSNEYDVLCFVKYLPEYSGYGTQDHGFGERAPTQINFASGELVLGQKVIGSVPVAKINKGVEYTLRVTVTGNTYFGMLIGDGINQRIVWEDKETNPFMYGTVGLRARRADVSFDYFKISDATSIPKPTLDISCKSSTSYSGFNVEIKGNLAFNGTAIPDAPILLSYSVNGGKSWEDLTLVYTGSDGSYSATWLPSVTGNYLIKATYEGDADTLGASSEIVNFAVTNFAEKNLLFSVSSNSTVTSLAFNSTTSELSFTVSGPSETTGYVKATIAKSLVSNAENIKVYLDGKQLNYEVTSNEDSWLLTFTYKHSTHQVRISLTTDSGETAFLSIEPWVWIASAIVVGVGLLIYLIKRK